jgi:hypothetical protein
VLQTGAIGIFVEMLHLATLLSQWLTQLKAVLGQQTRLYQLYKAAHPAISGDAYQEFYTRECIKFFKMENPCLEGLLMSNHRSKMGLT